MPDDPEMEALAKELGLSPDGTLLTGDAAKPPATGDTKPPVVGAAADGAQPQGDETQLDPLADLAKDPKAAMKALLAHPELGPTLNRWADNAAQQQVKAAVKVAKGDTEVETRQKAQEEHEDKFFESLTEEELTEELKNKGTAAAYGRYQMRAQVKESTQPENLEFAAQVQATRGLIQTYGSMVDESTLPDAIKDTLKPELFTKHGENALVEYGKAIYLALVDQKVQERFDTEWESAKESRLAELDQTRPEITPGRVVPGTRPDLLTTDTAAGIAVGLEEEAKKRK